jgi:hypothetical protein
MEVHNLAHPDNATERSRKLQGRMHQILVEQLMAKRLVPAKEKGRVTGRRHSRGGDDQ